MTAQKLPTARYIQNIYLSLTTFHTLAASFIWGINTLFLLDAGLSNTQAFAANAFFTVGQVLTEIPTGVIADMSGRRTSYLLGSLTLAVSTAVYWLAWQQGAAFWWWAGASLILGLGFSFFSGATEAWLVDALAVAKGNLSVEKVMARSQVVYGAAMLTGSVLGGVVAQWTNLGVPYLLRIGFLVITFGLAWFLMKDWGFEPDKSNGVVAGTRQQLRLAVKHGWQVPTIRWLMIAAPFASGAGFFAFYALQPYLLELYGNPNAYSVAGLAAALLAGSQMVGGMLVPFVRQRVARRTTFLLATTGVSAVLLILVGSISSFWLVVGLLACWGMMFSMSTPVRQAFLNEMIPSKQRATVLSFDALMGSSGGVVAQPALGKVADVYSYGLSFVGAGLVFALAVPFLLLAKGQGHPADAARASKG